jgi:putative methyltransferase (TIGR04325 family)
MSRIKSLARDWLPPAVFSTIQRLRHGGQRYEGGFSTWTEAAAESTGYNAEHILSVVLEATLKVQRGEAAFERDSVVFDKIEYAWPVTAGLMWAAARAGGTLNVLDFGGSLGSAYFQHFQLLKRVNHVRWNVIEQPHFTNVGKQQIQDKSLFFYDTIAECVAVTQPNVILLSSVLQYLEGYAAILEALTNIGASVLIIDRTPFSSEEKIVVQHTPSSIYAASYPMRVFSKSVFMDRLYPHWHLIASTVSADGLARSTVGTRFAFEGLLLESRR